MNVYGALSLAAGVFCGNIIVYGPNYRGVFVGSLAAIITLVAMFVVFDIIKSR